MIKLITSNLCGLFKIISIAMILASSYGVIKSQEILMKLLFLTITITMVAILWILLNAEFVAFVLLLGQLINVLVLLLVRIKFNHHLAKSLPTANNSKYNFSFIKSISIAIMFNLIFSYAIKDYTFMVEHNTLINSPYKFAKLILEDYNLMFPIFSIFFLVIIVGVVELMKSRSINN